MLTCFNVELLPTLCPGEKMRLKTQVLIIVAASLVSLVVMGGFGLYTMRQSMYDERHDQINQLLGFAGSQLLYFYSLE